MHVSRPSAHEGAAKAEERGGSSYLNNNRAIWQRERNAPQGKAKSAAKADRGNQFDVNRLPPRRLAECEHGNAGRNSDGECGEYLEHGRNLPMPLAESIV